MYGMATRVRARQRVVAAADGSLVARHAVLWAAEEAQHRRGELVIAHVDVASPDAIGLPVDLSGSEAILEASAEAASTRAPSVPVATLLLHGVVTDELIRLSRSASVLVVGVDPAKPRSAHGALGPIEDRVVLQARCPVVAVHTPSRPGKNHGADIVVGWVATDSGARALHAAAEEAAVRRALLTVVSVLPADSGHPDSTGPSAHSERALSGALAAARAEFRDLIVNVVQEEGDVVSVLKLRAQSAEVLVVGCPGAEEWRSVRTGPIVGALMREAPCPVMLVSRTAADLPPPHAELEHADVSKHTRVVAGR